MARLQRSADRRVVFRRIWSIHLLWGQPRRRLHWLLGGRPSDRWTWQLSTLWAGTFSGNVTKERIVAMADWLWDWWWTQLSHRSEWTGGAIWFAGYISYGMPQRLWNRHREESKFWLCTVIQTALKPDKYGFLWSMKDAVSSRCD